MHHEIGNTVESYGSYLIHEAISLRGHRVVGYFISGPCLPAVDLTAPCSLDAVHAKAQMALAGRISVWATARDWNNPPANA